MQPGEGMPTLSALQSNVQQQIGMRQHNHLRDVTYMYIRCNGNISSISGVSAPVDATGSRSVTTANCSDGTSNAQMSFNSTVTYAAAPTMAAPLPGIQSVESPTCWHTPAFATHAPSKSSSSDKRAFGCWRKFSCFHIQFLFPHSILYLKQQLLSSHRLNSWRNSGDVLFTWTPSQGCMKTQRCTLFKIN